MFLLQKYVLDVSQSVQMSFLSVNHASMFYAMIAWPSNLEAIGYGPWANYPMMTQITVVIALSAPIVITI